MNTAYAWAPITKIEDQPDGTVMVYGPMTDAGLDRDRQGLNQDWLDGAVPTWMKEGANVREQHLATRAVGVGVQLDRRTDGTFDLGSHVVDPVAVTKVKAGVLKGYSVGIKDPQINMGNPTFPNGEIVGGSIVEVSLVDRPANPRTLFTMVKADDAGELAEVEEPEVEETDEEEEPDTEEKADEGPAMYGPELTKAIKAAQRKKMAASGVAMPDGSFPIPDAGHLTSAIGRLGNYTGDKAAAKAHIISRARALGLVSSLPEDWGVSKADQVLAQLFGMSIGKADAPSDIADAQEAIACIGRLIASEATTLAAGRMSDHYDIKCLLDAVCALQYFIERESMETDEDGDADVALKEDGTLTDEGGTLDVAGSAYELKTDTPDETKVDNGVEPDMLKTAVAEAMKPLEDKLKLVEADLAKALAMPVAGGPVAMRTASQTEAARAKDANNLRAQAKNLLQKAADTQDPTLRAGYRELATELMQKADA